MMGENLATSLLVLNYKISKDFENLLSYHFLFGLKLLDINLQLILLYPYIHSNKLIKILYFYKYLFNV